MESNNFIEKEEFLAFKQKTIEKMCKLQYENMLLGNELRHLQDSMRMYETGYNILCDRIGLISRATHRLVKRSHKQTM